MNRAHIERWRVSFWIPIKQLSKASFIFKINGQAKSDLYFFYKLGRLGIKSGSLKIWLIINGKYLDIQPRLQALKDNN